MGLQRDRTRQAAKGLANLFIRQVSPVVEASYTDMGWLSDEGTSIDPQAQVIEHKDEGGNLSKISMGEVSNKFASHLAQVSQNEIDLIRNAAGVYHSFRYYGMINPWRWQYICTELAQIVPYIPRTWKAGKQNLPITAFFLKQDNTLYDTPEYYDIECNGAMHVENMILWLSPRRSWNYNTVMLLDISGFQNHCTLNAAAAWNSATKLLFNGSSQYGDLNDVCDIGTSQAVIEFWFKTPAANGTVQILMTKKASTGHSDVGWWFERTANNTIKFYASDGTNYGEVESANTITQNNWYHVLLYLDHISGYMQLYVNGALAQSLQNDPTNTISNSQHLLLAKGSTSYGNAYIGDIRIHTSSVTIDSATMALDHYNAEKGLE